MVDGRVRRCYCGNIIILDTAELNSGQTVCELHRLDTDYDAAPRAGSDWLMPT
jgi:hypothetical protein